MDIKKLIEIAFSTTDGWKSDDISGGWEILTPTSGVLRIVHRFGYGYDSWFIYLGAVMIEEIPNKGKRGRWFQGKIGWLKNVAKKEEWDNGANTHSSES